MTADLPPFVPGDGTWFTVGGGAPIEHKELDQARTALDELRKLESRSELMQQLDLQQQRLASSDKRVQTKIDKLFADARQVLTKFLDPRTANNLQQELAQAQPGKK